MIEPIIFWKDWNKYYKYPSVGTIKYLLLNRASNGFTKCIRIINKRIYLNIEETNKYFDDCKE